MFTALRPREDLGRQTWLTLAAPRGVQCNFLEDFQKVTFSQYIHVLLSIHAGLGCSPLSSSVPQRESPPEVCVSSVVGFFGRHSRTF